MPPAEPVLCPSSSVPDPSASFSSAFLPLCSSPLPPLQIVGFSSALSLGCWLSLGRRRIFVGVESDPILKTPFFPLFKIESLTGLVLRIKTTAINSNTTMQYQMA